MKRQVVAAMIAMAVWQPISATESLLSSFPSTEIATVHSEPGESRDSFVLRVSPQLSSYTRATGNEACGMIAARPDGKMSISLTSSGLQIACIVAYVEKGYVSTGITVHSHPAGRIVPTREDDAYMIAIGAPLARTFPNRCDFSDDDLAAPGYLVACGRVKFQQGGKVTRVSQ